MISDHIHQPTSYVSRLIQSKARALCRTPLFQANERPDLIQDLWVHLIEHEDRFDPRRASYETFANRVINNKAKSMLRHRRAAKRDPRRIVASINQPVDAGADDCAPLSDTLADHSGPKPSDFDHDHDLALLLKRMPVRDRVPLTTYISGATKQELYQRHGMNRREVEELLNRAAATARLLRMGER